jgi:hypothetical protein
MNKVTLNDRELKVNPTWVGVNNMLEHHRG